MRYVQDISTNNLHYAAPDAPVEDYKPAQALCNKRFKATTIDTEYAERQGMYCPRCIAKAEKLALA